MVSILSMAVNTVTSFFIYILKAIFSMFLWFLKSFIKVLKLLYCLFPVCTLIFVVLLLLNIFFIFTTPTSFYMTTPKVLTSSGIIDEKVFHIESVIAPKLFNDLKSWWLASVYSYKSTPTYYPLLLLSVVMFVPVITVFLCISALLSSGHILFYAIILDVAFYLIRAAFGKSFVHQFLGRYCFLFPEAGKRHYEKSYEKWLRKHHEEFEEEADYIPSKNRKYSDFYEDEYDIDYRGRRSRYDYEDEEDYDDEDYDPDDYDEDDYDVDDYEDEESDEFYEEYPENYEDDYPDEYDDEEDDDGDDEIDDNDRRRGSNKQKESVSQAQTVTSFDFFAGCNSRESVEKKYRSLAKLYHPDNMDGDTASLQEINSQYELAKKRFPR